MPRPATTPATVADIWTNWPRTVPSGPGLKFLPRTISDLVGVAQLARGGVRVKASGSRWSSSAAARAETGWVDTSALNRIHLLKDISGLADELPAGKDVSNFVLVQGGAKIHEIATTLWSNGKSIPTLGGSMGQSISGAISTSTHGSDIELPPVSGMVRAIHLVAPGGQEYWLEHPDRPVASQRALERHYPDWHESIRHRRNAAAFNAALVALGRCGFIYNYVLEVEDRYYLKQQRIDASWPVIREHLKAAAESGDWLRFIRSGPLPFYPGVPGIGDTGNMRALQVTLNPDGGGQAWWTYRIKLNEVEGSVAIVKGMARWDMPWVGKEMSYREQAELMHLVGTALDPGAAAAAGGGVGALVGVLAGGPWGAIIGGIAGAIGGGVTAACEDVFNCISRSIYPSQLGADSVIDASYKVTSGGLDNGKKEGEAGYWDCYATKYAEFWRFSPKAQYTEVFFDAQKTDYLRFTDEMLKYFATPGTGRQAGYISIRFTGRSEAPLAMQRWPVTASVELILLEDLDPRAREKVEHVNDLASRHDVRFHWGMLRPPPPGVPGAAVAQELEQWRRGAAMLGVSARDGFSSELSQRYGLEPSRRPRSDFLLMACGG